MKKILLKSLLFLPLVALFIAGCDEEDMDMVHDPDAADEVSIDRFSSDAGTLMVRDSSNGLPDANEPINYDSGAPFITKGLGPSGQVVEYYNFDVQSTTPAPIYVLFRDGESMPVDGQLNIIDDIPGDSDYNDFWHVHKVTVPSDYVANTVASLDEINEKGYTVTETTMLVNCPVVPKGSTASKRIGGGSSGLVKGWYREKIVYYFSFEEKALSPSGGMIPTSPIYVAFNINPDETGGGPASGFMTETGTSQTHNVVATIPSDAGYSPMWLVNVYDNASFSNVSDLTSAQNAPLKGTGVATVNCPIVSVQ